MDGVELTGGGQLRKGAAKSSVLRPSMHTRVVEEEEESTAQLRSCSPDLGVARSSGNRRWPWNLEF